MTLKHCIIHSIERATPGTEVSTSFREQENPATGPAYSLFEQLKQSFQRSSQKQYGYFDRESDDNPLPGWIREHHQGTSSFSRVSQRILEHLQQKMGENDEAFSADLMIAVDSVMDQDQLYIFWIDHVDASLIDHSLDVVHSRYIDSNKMAYSARVFVDEWLQEDSQKYMSLITSRGSKPISDAFSGFMGFSTGVNLIEETHEFLSIVDQYAQSLPEDKVSDHRGQILEYCVDQDKQGAPVVFEDISRQLDEGQPGNFSEFVAERQQAPAVEMYTDRSSLKRYVRYFGRDKNMSISFSADMFGQEIVYDEVAGTLTIKQIPKSLKQQLKTTGTQ